MRKFAALAPSRRELALTKIVEEYAAAGFDDVVVTLPAMRVGDEAAAVDALADRLFG